VLTDSTHGEMRAFELNTVRLTDADGSMSSASRLRPTFIQTNWNTGDHKNCYL